ncbi:acetyltransferase [Novosphingobium sp. AP12]|jgi:putative colanic acid biosynthesis acetyltransferase WcaF|uniref:acetyltransferase n=1 Tax=Novosphingobium sp. AP12 TaxID=1144305 RepID=UPI00027214B2|nr:acetyltransferase [Novosphingobium sp. AP12]EJL32327.1 acetyltransferase (isoleucine patch superfamily) [Novosphingobium sp. AP12]
MTEQTDEAGGLLVMGKAGATMDRPSFSLRNRIERTLFMLVWVLGASWTPPPLHAWRCLLLRWCGARIGSRVKLYGSTAIWHPANLDIEDGATVGPRVRIYNQGAISIGAGAVVSQDVHLCASSHNVSDPNFQLVLRPIRIGPRAWIAADAFVGPGVTVGEGAVLGARGVAIRDLEPWSIYRGNPAAIVKKRKLL